MSGIHLLVYFGDTGCHRCLELITMQRDAPYGVFFVGVAFRTVTLD